MDIDQHNADSGLGGNQHHSDAGLDTYSNGVRFVNGNS